MGFLLRAALGPKTRASLASLGLILDHPVKESRGMVSISSEIRPVYVQSIYVPSILVWDWRYVKWNFVVQVSGKRST